MTDEDQLKAFLGEARYTQYKDYYVMKEAVFPQRSWKLFKRSRVREKPDEAIEAIKNWWHLEGQFLTEDGVIEWGRTPLLDETSKPNGK